MVLGTAVAGLTCLADVTSANIVGYTGNNLVAGKYNLIALPFTAVAGGNMKLTEAMTGANWYPNDDANQADNIKVWDATTGGYVSYYYWEDDTHEYDGWYDCKTGFSFFDDCPENADGLETGWTAWYLSRGGENPNVTFSGAVESADDFKVTIYGGSYNLIANPFPSSFQPNADQPWWVRSEPKLVDWNGPTANDDANQADNIKLWDAATGGYTTYYYWEDSSHEYDGWYDAKTGFNFFEDDPDRPENTNGIKGGEVFWYLSRAAKGNNRNITFLNPTK